MVGMSRSQVPVDQWDAAFGCQQLDALERGRQVIGAATNENLDAAPWRQGLKPRLVAQHERGALLFGAQVEGRALHLDHRDAAQRFGGGWPDKQDARAHGSYRNQPGRPADLLFPSPAHAICSSSSSFIPLSLFSPL